MLKQCLAPMAAVISVWKILKYENLTDINDNKHKVMTIAHKANKTSLIS